MPPSVGSSPKFSWLRKYTIDTRNAAIHLMGDNHSENEDPSSAQTQIDFRVFHDAPINARFPISYVSSFPLVPRSFVPAPLPYPFLEPPALEPDSYTPTEHLESGPIGREYRPEITGHAMVCRVTPRHARIYWESLSFLCLCSLRCWVKN